jgi:hypothetical protein
MVYIATILADSWEYGDERGGGGGAIGDLGTLLVEVELLSLSPGGWNVTCLVTRLPDIHDLIENYLPRTELLHIKALSNLPSDRQLLHHFFSPI